jgi:hypothetical protein
VLTLREIFIEELLASARVILVSNADVRNRAGARFGIIDEIKNSQASARKTLLGLSTM